MPRTSLTLGQRSCEDLRAFPNLFLSFGSLFLFLKVSMAGTSQGALGAGWLRRETAKPLPGVSFHLQNQSTTEL